MSENGEIYTAGKNFTLPPALTRWTNSTSACIMIMMINDCEDNGDIVVCCYIRTSVAETDTKII